MHAKTPSEKIYCLISDRLRLLVKNGMNIRLFASICNAFSKCLPLLSIPCFPCLKFILFVMLLQYKKYGLGKPAVIILHGLMGSSKNWHKIGTELKKSYPSLIPDLRNHGESFHGIHSISAMRNDITALLDSLSLDKIHLIGHSMGGMVAMMLAADFPGRVESLTVVDIAPEANIKNTLPIFNPLISLDLTTIRRKDDADSLLSETIPEKSVRHFLLQNLKRQEDGDYGWQCNLPELYKFLQDNDKFMLNPDAVYNGATLFIGGGKSNHNLPAHKKIISHHFPNHQLAMIEDVGHWVHFEAPAEFLNLLTNFLAQEN